MKKALLVGSNGFLGEYWAEVLRANGFETYAIAKGANGKFIDANKFTNFDLIDSDWPNFIGTYLNELRPEAIVLNAGIDAPPGTGFSNFSDFNLDSWKEIFNVNLYSTVSVLNSVSCIKDYYCHIVIIGSQYATISPNKRLYSHENEGKGAIKHPAYAASKSALKATMRQYATELADRGVVINMLSPGGISNGQNEEFTKKFSMNTPINRLGKPEELSSALNFLLDESNSFCIGIDLLVDGGYSLW